MPHNPEDSNTDETLPLNKEHPSYLKLADKIRELEGDGISPQSDEYITEVEKFVRTEPKLAAELATENRYLSSIISRMNGENEPSTAKIESESNIETIHKQAFATVQEIRQLCNKLAIELKNRADQRMTPLIEEANLKPLFRSAQPFEDALSSNQTEQAVEAIKGLVRAVSSIEKGYSPRVSDDTESLKKLGFYLREFGERSDKLARMYGENDSPEALEISHSALELKSVTDEKLTLITQLYRILTER